MERKFVSLNPLLPNTDLFEKNRPLIRQKAPFLEPLMALTETYPLTKSNSGEWNLFLNQEKKEGFLHSPSGAEKEAIKHYQHLIGLNCPRLFIFGAALGYGLSYLIQWLSEKDYRDLILLESDLRLLKRLFSTPFAEDLLKHSRVHFFWIGSHNFWQQNQKKIDYFLSQPFEISCLPHQLKLRKEEFEELKSHLISSSIDLNVYCSEYLETSPSVYQNILENTLTLDHSVSLVNLKEAFKKVPCVICGAAASLNLQKKALLKFKDKGLLFAGGRALSVLNDLEVEPNLALGIDPFEQHAQTLKCNNFFEIPFIYRARISSKALKLAHGQIIHTPGAVGYSFVEWLEDQLCVPKVPLQEGLNVVNFNLEIARFLGCDPIILVGVDLAYQDQNAYSSSIPDEQVLPEKNQIQENDFTLNRGYIQKGARGQPVFTLWKWVEEAKWIASFAKRNPATQLIQTSLEGLYIENVQYLSFESAVNSLKGPKKDYSSLLHSLFQTSSKIPSSCQLKNTLKLFIKSIECTLKGLTQLIEGIQTSSYSILLLQEKVEKELAYIHLLKPLDELFMRLEPHHLNSCVEEKKALFLKKKLQEYQSVFNQFMMTNF